MRILLAAAAIVLVYVGLALVGDVRSVLASLRTFPRGAFALALALVLAAYTLRALRWRLYLHRLGVTDPRGSAPVGFGNGLAMGLAPGKSGQFVKAYYLHRRAGLPYSVGVPATFAERIADAFSIVSLLLLALALAPGFDATATLVASLLFLATLLALRHRDAGVRFAHLTRRIPWLARHREGIVSSHASLRAHLSLRELAAPAVIGLVGYLFEVLALQALAAALGHALPFGSAALAIALADVAAMLTFVPGGLGVAEGGLLVALAAFGLPLADAAVVTLLFRVCTLWLGMALGAAAAAALELGARRASSQAADLG